MLWALDRGDANYRRQLEDVIREAGTMWLLRSCNNVVRILGMGLDSYGDRTTLIMDYYETTLEQLCLQVGVGSAERSGKSSGLTLSTVCRLMASAAGGLTQMHALEPPVIHGDLKASNMFLVSVASTAEEPQFEVRIGDFSSAKVCLAAQAGRGPP